MDGVDERVRHLAQRHGYVPGSETSNSLSQHFVVRPLGELLQLQFLLRLFGVCTPQCLGGREHGNDRRERQGAIIENRASTRHAPSSRLHDCAEFCAHPRDTRAAAVPRRNFTREACQPRRN